MAESKPRAIRAEMDNKLSTAKIAAGGVIMAAAISTVVSYFVSNNTVRLERERIQIEESLEKAKIFADLVDTVRTSDDPTYALLALWKVFPQDERLIVTTALMNPTPQTVSTLHAFGIADKLDEYNETIKNMMINAPRERRKDFSITYRDISPETVLAVNFESAIRSAGDENELFDLKNLIGFRPELLRPLIALMNTDPRVQESPALHLRMARLIYDKDSQLLLDLLDQADQDDLLFHVVAREMAGHLTLLAPSDQDRLMTSSLAALARMQGNARLEGKIGDVIRLFSSLTELLEPTSDQKAQFSKAVVPAYLSEAIRVKPDPLKLIAISRYSSRDTAEKLFLTTLACAPHEKAFVFFWSFPVRDLAMQDWPSDMVFDDGRTEAKRRITARGEDCSEW